MLSADDKVGFLQTLAWQATDSGQSLFVVLKAHYSRAFSSNWNGKQVVATSGNGRSVSYITPDFFKTLTQDEVRRMWVQLLAIYNSALSTLGIAQPADADLTQDKSILQTMLADDRMQEITTVQDDFTVIRYPTYGPTQ